MSAPVTLKIKFKSSTFDQFMERYAVDVSRGGIFIRTKQPLAVGTPLNFEFTLQDGSALLSGDGTVIWIREPDAARPSVAAGMGVRFDKLTSQSQGVLDRILAQKEGRAPRPSTPPKSEPVASPAAAAAIMNAANASSIAAAFGAGEAADEGFSKESTRVMMPEQAAALQNEMKGKPLEPAVDISDADLPDVPVHAPPGRASVPERFAPDAHDEFKGAQPTVRADLSMLLPDAARRSVSPTSGAFQAKPPSAASGTISGEAKGATAERKAMPEVGLPIGNPAAPRVDATAAWQTTVLDERELVPAVAAVAPVSIGPIDAKQAWSDALDDKPTSPLPPAKSLELAQTAELLTLGDLPASVLAPKAEPVKPVEVKAPEPAKPKTEPKVAALAEPAKPVEPARKTEPPKAAAPARKTEPPAADKKPSEPVKEAKKAAETPKPVAQLPKIAEPAKPAPPRRSESPPPAPVVVSKRSLPILPVAVGGLALAALVIFLLLRGGSSETPPAKPPIAEVPAPVAPKGPEGLPKLEPEPAKPPPAAPKEVEAPPTPPKAAVVAPKADKSETPDKTKPQPKKAEGAQEAKAEPKALARWLEVRSNPPGAGVQLDGKLVGYTPTTLRSGAIDFTQPHTLKLKKPGYEESVHEVPAEGWQPGPKHATLTISAELKQILSQTAKPETAKPETAKPDEPAAPAPAPAPAKGGEAGSEN